MLGWDGVAVHQSGTFITAAPVVNAVLVAAPPAGFEIVVFSIAFSNGGGNSTLHNGVPTVLWQMLAAATRPLAYTDDRGLFRCGDAQALLYDEPVSGRLNWTFEIRPTGA